MKVTYNHTMHNEWNLIYTALYNRQGAKVLYNKKNI